MNKVLPSSDIQQLCVKLDGVACEDINVGFDFTYAVEPGKSKTTVQADVNTAVRAYFAEKLYIGEPIYITKIYQIINRVEGVVDTIKVKPVMKQTGNYSNLALNVEDIMSPDGTFLKCPKNCGTIHPHFVYYNSLSNGMVIDKSLLGEKIKKKKSRRKK